MKCPKCNSQRAVRNGRRRGKQCYRCQDCGRQFIESPTERSYPLSVKQLCLKMYLNGMGLRGIERVTEIHHTTIMNWIKEAGLSLPDAPEESELPEITEIDELQTFVGSKKNKLWIWTVVNHWKPGIILWTVGNRSGNTFQKLWLTIKCWSSFWYVTDGWKVYSVFVQPEEKLI
jgi:insertion element IS1 protein InsB